MKDYFSKLIAKKMLLASSLVGLTIATCGSVYASVAEIVEGARFYVGAGVGYNRYGIHGNFKKAVENNQQGSVKITSADLLMPVLGVKFKDNFGLEFGYAFHKKLKATGGNSGNLKINNGFLDIIGYMPIGSSSFDLIGGVGLGLMSMRSNDTGIKNATGGNYNKFGFRAKIGGQYNFDDHFGVRALLGYQQVGHKDNKYALRNVQSANLDVTYLI